MPEAVVEPEPKGTQDYFSLEAFRAKQTKQGEWQDTLPGSPEHKLFVGLTRHVEHLCPISASHTHHLCLCAQARRVQPLHLVRAQ